MWPFTPSRCDLCDLLIYMLAALLVLVVSYMCWKYEFKERDHRGR